RSVVGAGDRLVRATFHGGAHAALVIELGRLMAEADLVGGELVEHGGLLLVLGAVGQVVVGTAGAGALGGVGLGAAGPVGGGGAAAGAVAVPGAGHERRPARARVVDRPPHAGRVGLLGRGERVELGADLVDFGHGLSLRFGGQVHPVDPPCSRISTRTSSTGTSMYRRPLASSGSPDRNSSAVSSAWSQLGTSRPGWRNTSSNVSAPA